MRDLRIKKVYKAHLNLDHKQAQGTDLDRESNFHQAFQDHFQEVLNHKPIFSNEVEHFIEQVVQNTAILEPIQKRNLQELSRQCLQVYQFFLQQPSDDIQAKFYQVHVVLMLLVAEYGSFDAITLIELLWSTYVVKSKLQHDLAATLYELALKPCFKLSHLRHLLYTENQIQQKTQTLKDELKNKLEVLNKSETLILVLETLDKKNQ